jgi:hypothetical protein
MLPIQILNQPTQLLGIHCTSRFYHYRQKAISSVANQDAQDAIADELRGDGKSLNAFPSTYSMMADTRFLNLFLVLLFHLLCSRYFRQSFDRLRLANESIHVHCKATYFFRIHNSPLSSRGALRSSRSLSIAELEWLLAHNLCGPLSVLL